MNLDQIKTLIDSLKKDLEKNRNIYDHTKENDRAKYVNILNLCSPFLKEHQLFFGASMNHVYSSELEGALDYIELLLKLKSEERIVEKERIFLKSAKDHLKQAGIVFGHQDFSGVSNKLNTCVELALKDVLEIPTTIKGIKVSNILDIMISNNVGPKKYLEEVRTNVLMDNLVKHQGLSPIEMRAGTAIASVENLLKKLPLEPFILPEKIKEKIWKGISK